MHFTDDRKPKAKHFSNAVCEIHFWCTKVVELSYSEEEDAKSHDDA